MKSILKDANEIGIDKESKILFENFLREKEREI